MSAEIKRFDIILDHGMAELSLNPDGDYVMHTDHLASHAFDEAVERAAFEDAMTDRPYERYITEFGYYDNKSTERRWQGWLACAKSRAKRFGGVE